MGLLGHEVEKKKGKLKNKITGSLSGFILIVFLLAMGVYAVGSIVMGILSLLSDQARKESVYNTIKNRGGVYRYIKDEQFEQLGNYNVVETIFQAEYDSFDGAQSSFTIPKISYSDLKTNRDNGSDGSDSVSYDVMWDMSSFTYEYRTHWEMMLALASLSKMKDEKGYEEFVEKAASKMDKDGKISDPETLFNSVTKEEAKNVIDKLIKSGLFTEIDYYTNYASKNTVSSMSDTSEGPRINTQYWSGHKNVVPGGYNYARYYTNGSGIITSMENPVTATFSNAAFYWFAEQKRGDFGMYIYNTRYDDPYAYVTTDGYVFPALLIRKASNWLWTYDNFSYVKTSMTAEADKDTSYQVVKYRKTSRVKEFLDFMHEDTAKGGLGLDETLDTVFIQMLLQAEDIGGGTTASEFKKAYDYYIKYDKEMVINYYEPLYAGLSGDEIITSQERTAYTAPVDVVKTDTSAMKIAMQKIIDDQSGSNKRGFSVISTGVGLEVARVLYKYKCPYEDSYTSEEVKNIEDSNKSITGLMQCGNYSSPGTSVDTFGWGDVVMTPGIYGDTSVEHGSDTVDGMKRSLFFGDYKDYISVDKVGGTVNSSTGNDKVIGLSKTGFICYILRCSIFCPQDGDYAWCESTGASPDISTIYNSSVNFKFDCKEELVAGDLGIVTIDDGAINGDSNNIGYYVGKDSDGRHVFYYMDKSSGCVERACLKGEAKNAAMKEVDFKYFFRFYKGTKSAKESGLVIDEFSHTGTTGYVVYSAYRDILDVLRGTDAEKSKEFIQKVANGGYTLDEALAKVRNQITTSAHSNEEVKHVLAGLSDSVIKKSPEKTEWRKYCCWNLDSTTTYHSQDRDSADMEKYSALGKHFDSFHSIDGVGNVEMQAYNSASDEQKSIAYTAVYDTSIEAVGGLCAQWVIDVYNSSGVGYVSTGLDSNDANRMWEAYCKDSDLSKLKVGMIIAVQHSGPSGDSWDYGHVGIYIGDGKVRHNVGGVAECSVEQWIESFDPYGTVGWGFANPDISFY